MESEDATIETPSGLPPWMFIKGKLAWWYDESRHQESLLSQALRYACRNKPECLLYWDCPQLRAALGSEDGYVPGVRWNPIYDTDKPVIQQRLSIHRFLAALRFAYDHNEPQIPEELAEVMGKRPLSLARKRLMLAAEQQANSLQEQVIEVH